MLYSCPKVFMHLTTDGTQLISGREIFQTASQWLWVYRHLLKILSFPLGSCSDVWLLDHQGVVLVIFGGTFHEVSHNGCSSQCTLSSTTDRGPIFFIPLLVFLTPCLSGKGFPKKWRN